MCGVYGGSEAIVAPGRCIGRPAILSLKPAEEKGTNSSNNLKAFKSPTRSNRIYWQTYYSFQVFCIWRILLISQAADPRSRECAHYLMSGRAMLCERYGIHGRGGYLARDQINPIFHELQIRRVSQILRRLGSGAGTTRGIRCCGKRFPFDLI